MERFKAEGIDFAFPTQTLHLAGDEERPLTVGQQGVSGEEEFSHGAVLARVAALGAQTVLTNRIPASGSARPWPVEFVGPLPQADRQPTSAPLADESPQQDGQGRTGKAEDEEAARGLSSAAAAAPQRPSS